MSELQQVFSITGPIFVLVALGYLALKSGFAPPGTAPVLSAFAVNFAIPALLFKSIAERPLSELIDSTYLLAYSLGSLLAFALLFTGSRVWGRRSVSHSAILGMGGSFSNSLMIGLPVVTLVFGQAAIVPLSLTIVVESCFMFPLALALAESGLAGGRSRSRVLASALLRVPRNPIVASVALGLLFSAAGLPLPGPATRVIDLLAASVGGVALFAIGAMLVGTRLPALSTDVLTVATTKLLLHPLLVLLAFILLGYVDPVMTGTAIILASIPMFGVYPVIAEKYGLGQTCAALLLITIALSFVTLNGSIWMVGQHLPLP